jgi:hypothetical protein
VVYQDDQVLVRHVKMVTKLAPLKTVEEEIPSWWLDGSAFLNEEESVWPTDLPWMAAKEELRSVHVYLIRQQSKNRERRSGETSGFQPRTFQH